VEAIVVRINTKSLLKTGNAMLEFFNSCLAEKCLLEAEKIEEEVERK
jgi:hypothetical protein